MEAWLALLATENRAEQAPAEGTPPPLSYTYEPPAFPAATTDNTPLFDAPPVAQVQIIGLPSPNSGRVYRLQIGAFSSAETAARAVRQLQAAGFDATQELTSNNMRRVFAAGIPAASVSDAAQRLGSIGFSQVWVRE